MNMQRNQSSSEIFDSTIPMHLGFPFTIGFDLHDGKSHERTTTKRYLSQMKNMYLDQQSFDKQLQTDDPLVYEFYELDLPSQSSDLKFGTTIIYPGRVGQEFYMTKGHFHQILDTAEVYYTLSGTGLMLMETPEGETKAKSLKPGQALYVPPRWAHRSINTDETPLVLFFVFRSDAGHDYGTIEKKGFRQLVLACEPDEPIIVPNPRWIDT